VMKRNCIFIFFTATFIVFAKAQQVFTKVDPFSYLNGNGSPPTFFTPFGAFQNLDSTYTLIGCTYAGTHTSKYFNYIVHLKSNGDFDSSMYISPSGIGGIYTCATFLLYDSVLTSNFTSARWDHDTAITGNTLWTFHLTKDNDGTTYIQLLRDNGTVTLLDTIGKTFYTFSPYLVYANAPLIAPLADDNLLIIYTNRNEELEMLKYNTHTYLIDYKFTVTKDILAYFSKVLIHSSNASGHICMIKTLDNGYLLASKINRLDYDWQNDMLLMKFDSLGNFYWPFSTGEHELQNIQHRVYPNPTTSKVNFELHEGGDFEIIIIDVNGRTAYKEAAQANATINTSNWSNGVYFYTISNNHKVAKGKLIKY
jgi:hypothetical protein